eukprot:803236_1
MENIVIELLRDHQPNIENLFYNNEIQKFPIETNPIFSGYMKETHTLCSGFMRSIYHKSKDCCIAIIGIITFYSALSLSNLDANNIIRIGFAALPMNKPPVVTTKLCQFGYKGNNSRWCLKFGRFIIKFNHLRVVTKWLLPQHRDSWECKLTYEYTRDEFTFADLYSNQLKRLHSATLHTYTLWSSCSDCMNSPEMRNHPMNTKRQFHHQLDTKYFWLRLECTPKPKWELLYENPHALGMTDKQQKLVSAMGYEWKLIEHLKGIPDADRVAYICSLGLLPKHIGMAVYRWLRVKYGLGRCRRAL